MIGGFDLVGSTERQALFLWQVSGERFQDDTFLEEAVDKYHKFIQLKPKAVINRSIIVPTYQIDLMWHTHILSSIGLYEKDCKAIMGSTMHHDDSFTDRTEGGILDASFQSTCAMWKAEYGEDYIVEGGMYRGEPPLDFHRPGWDPDEKLYAMVGNLRMVGKMGASSTFQSNGKNDATSNTKTDVFSEFNLEDNGKKGDVQDDPGFIKWAPITGKTSDGKAAFIPSDTKYRRELRELGRMDDYVLGKPEYPATSKAGYYHFETREAHQILRSRVKGRVQRTKQYIAELQGCCGGGTPSLIAHHEKTLQQLEEMLLILDERVKSKGPSSKLTRDLAKSTEADEKPTDRSFYGENGVWLYPPILWTGTGGACGGAVACSGAQYADGGAACAGGGCGGGGCGGGGCGG